MNIQIVSDLHHEYFKDIVNIPKTANYIALLGDIGYPKNDNYDEFLASLSSRYEKVFVIAGNHEFYNSNTTMDSTTQIIESKCSKYNNVYFLNNKSIIIGNYRVIGTTLWTNIPVGAETYIRDNLNDCSRIKKYVIKNNIKRKRAISPSDITRFHKIAVEFIQLEVECAKELNQKVIVLTHHAPTFNGTLNPKYARSDLDYAYASDLDYLICSPIVAWFYGHTHFATNFEMNGVRIANNPKGYPSESNIEFNPEIAFEL